MIYLLLCLIILVLINGWTIKQLCDGALFVRLIKVDSLQALSVTERYDYINDFKERISGEPWVRSGKEEDRCLGALRWIMNKVSTVEPNTNKNPLYLLNSVESGHGAVCSEMSVLYRNVLSAVGIRSRIISLSRNMFDAYDSHETVEVFLSGKWVVMDPTFNISFSDARGQFLSAQEIKGYFLSGKHKEINIIFHGEVTYPPRVESYYMDILPCFNNVFAVDPGRRAFLLKVPPLRYWFGPRRYYEKLPGESVSHLDFARKIYCISVVVLPILILSILFIMA